MQKKADERAKVVDAKLAEIGDQVSGLRADFGTALKASAEETGKALDRVLASCTAIQSALANKVGKLIVNSTTMVDNRSASGDATADTAEQSPNEEGVSGVGDSAPEVSALPLSFETFGVMLRPLRLTMTNYRNIST